MCTTFYAEQQGLQMHTIAADAEAYPRMHACAVVAFTGVYAASMVTGKGPVTLLLQHVADPAHTNVLQALQR